MPACFVFCGECRSDACLFRCLRRVTPSCFTLCRRRAVYVFNGLQPTNAALSNSTPHELSRSVLWLCAGGLYDAAAFQSSRRDNILDTSLLKAAGRCRYITGLRPMYHKRFRCRYIGSAAISGWGAISPRPLGTCPLSVLHTATQPEIA